MNFKDLTIKKIQEGFQNKKFSVTELVQNFLGRIKEKDRDIFAFLSLTDEGLVFSLAKKIDKLIMTGGNIPFLTGVPVAIKDNILVKGMKCTSGSKILENYIAPYDATVVKKLKNLNSLIIGKTNLDEFAMGSSTENSAFGITKNPCNLDYVPGGSSGGSAAAVAADFSVFALGSDTGGSVRQPASFCGVVGLKPTYGAISRYGLAAFASSLDQIGPITKTVEDCKIVFNAIKGKDSFDSTSAESKVSSFNLKISDIKIGVPKEYFTEKGIDSGVKKNIENIIKKYEEAGGKLIEVSLPHTEYALSCYYIIAPSEASANLARYEGIKYGYSVVKEEKRKIDNLLDVYLQNREAGFGKEVKRRIMLGTYSLSSGYYDAYYLTAQKIRFLIRNDFEEVFKKVDFIISPTCPTPAFKIKEKTKNLLAMYYSDVFTVAASLAGLPAISIPSGLVNNLPVGLQIIGKKFEEEKIFEIGEIFEKLCL